MKLFFSLILMAIYSAAIFPIVFYIGLWFAWGNAISTENLLKFSILTSVLFFLYQLKQAYNYSNEELEENT